MKQAAAIRFRRWTDAIGVTKVADLIGCDASFVSHLRAGRKRPSLDLAIRIEEKSDGRVRCVDWAPAQPAEETAAA